MQIVLMMHITMQVRTTFRKKVCTYVRLCIAVVRAVGDIAPFIAAASKAAAFGYVDGAFAAATIRTRSACKPKRTINLKFEY
jgi:hypothetical protein